MTLKWDIEIPEPQPKERSTIRCGPIMLSVSSHDVDTIWQFISLSLGTFSSASQRECEKSWPVEAIALAREALDEFESKLV